MIYIYIYFFFCTKTNIDECRNLFIFYLIGTLDDALRHTLDIGKSVEYLLSTGNLISKSGLGLMQVCFYHIFSIEIRR